MYSPAYCLFLCATTPEEYAPVETDTEKRHTKSVIIMWDWDDGVQEDRCEDVVRTDCSVREMGFYIDAGDIECGSGLAVPRKVNDHFYRKVATLGFQIAQWNRSKPFLCCFPLTSHYYTICCRLSFFF